jgi:predicted amidohydrolase
VIDPATCMYAIRNLGLRAGRIAAITAARLRRRDTIVAHELVGAPGFVDVQAHGQTEHTYRFQARDRVKSSFELELGTTDVAAWYAARAAGQRINYGVSIGHIKVRMAVLRDTGTVMPIEPGAY